MGDLNIMLERFESGKKILEFHFDDSNDDPSHVI